MTAYYNDIDKNAVQTLRANIRASRIASGVVDPTSIKEITDDLAQYTQAHFFAGIGGWSYALRLAGWPDDTPVWTGSCPCQPFSAAGNRKGTADTRHLWPDWYKLICKYRPPIIFGEQVASPDGLAWLDLVYTDLEAAGYAVGSSDLPAASVGAPHIRQRLYFGAVGVGEDAICQRWGGWSDGDKTGNEREVQTSGLCSVGGLVYPDGQRREEWGSGVTSNALPILDETGSAWSGLEWLYCRDGKYRPAKPGVFPLADGLPERVGKLRGYGNAIVPQLAALFIRAFVSAL